MARPQASQASSAIAPTEKPSAPKVCLHRVNAARADVRALRAATALSEAHYDVTIIDVDADQSAIPGLSPDVKVQHIALPARSKRSRFPLARGISLVRQFMRRVRLLRRFDADIYHALEIQAVLACCIAGFLRRKPVIYEVYDVPFDGPYYQANLRRRIYRRLNLLVLRAIGPRLAGVIVTSPGHGREMRRLLGRPPSAYVRNIPEYEAPTGGDRLREWLGVDHTTKIALYQGYFTWNRALDALVSAAKYLEPDTLVVLRGEGPSRPEIERLIARENLGDRVRFVPFAPRGEQMRWTAGADIGLTIYRPNLSPNVRGILPNKVFEYMMAGVPVLNTLPEVANLLDTYQAGRTVTSLEPEVLAGAISAMVNDSAALEQMRRNALAATARELRWDVEQRQLLALYERILSA